MTSTRRERCSPHISSRRRSFRAPSLTRRGGAVHLKLETALPTGSFKVRGAIYALWRATLSASPQTPSASRRRAATHRSRRGEHRQPRRSCRLRGAADRTARVDLPAVQPEPVKASRIRDLGARIVETVRICRPRSTRRTTTARARPRSSSTTRPIRTSRSARRRSLRRSSNSSPASARSTCRWATRRSCAASRPPRNARTRRCASSAWSRRGRPAYAQSWRSGEAIETASADTIADGLAVRRALAPNVAAIRALVDEIVEVGEDEMLDAMDWLETREHVIAEPSGAAATAAYLRGTGVDADPTVLLVTGANMSPDATALLTARRQRARCPRP